jgi:DNA-binding NarL/FixJ family response regulator
MTEGSPMMSNQGNTAPMTPPVSEAPQELVMVFADQVPPQLEHWLRKRSMRLQMNEASAIRPDDIRASGARYVILDAEALPAGQDPVELVRNLRQSIPELRITVSTARGDDAHVRNLTEAGAQGVVVKQPYVADLVFALQAEAEGRSFVSGRATERERAAVQITAREREVLELMANGHSNQAIGERLSISVKTVEAHRARLFKKLGASNVADAVLLAIRTGLVMP